EFGLDLPAAAALLVTDSLAQIDAYDPPNVLAGTPHRERLVSLGAVRAGAVPRPPAGAISLFFSVGLAGTEAFLLDRLAARAGQARRVPAGGQAKRGRGARPRPGGRSSRSAGNRRRSPWGGSRAAGPCGGRRALHAGVSPEPPYRCDDDAGEFTLRFAVQRRQRGFVLAEARHGGYLVGYASGMPLRPSTSWWRGLTTALPAEITAKHPGRTFALADLLGRASWRRQGIPPGPRRPLPPGPAHG